MGEVKFSSRAFIKIILHAAKYPHCAVNGLLLAEETNDSKNSKSLVLVDAFPLFHLFLPLSPMTEVALTQIDHIASSNGLVVAGYYFANKNFGDNSPDVTARRIADKIAENYSSTCLVGLNNAKITLNMEESPLFVSQNSGSKWTSVSSHVSNKTLKTANYLLQQRFTDELVDFDNHLDNISLDWHNEKLNKRIEAAIPEESL